MAANPVLPTLYRSLLRMARQLDAAPMSKALLIAQPELLFDRRSREIIRLPELSGSAGHDLARRLIEFNGGEFYAPEASAQAAVRLARKATSAVVDPVDAGLQAIRTLSLAVAGGAELESRHAFECGWPSAVERVTAVRRGTAVRTGSLLLTHPVSCLKQPSLHHAVILLVSVDDDSVEGVVLNKPLDLTLGAAVSEEVRTDLLGDTLAAAPLHKGGDVSERQLLLLHECTGLSDSAAVQAGSGLFVTDNFVQLGGEHEALARFPGDHEIVWKHMELLWTQQSDELHRRIDALGPLGRQGDGES